MGGLPVVLAQEAGVDLRQTYARLAPRLALQAGRYAHATVFQPRNSAGRSRQGPPVRAIHNTASTNNRGLGPVRPGSHSRPRQCGAMKSHWVSVSVVRIKVASHLATLNYSNHDLEILKRQHTLGSRCIDFRFAV
jgi:hypothetical protein